jgi:hypothetical protein
VEVQAAAAPQAVGKARAIKVERRYFIDNVLCHYKPGAFAQSNIPELPVHFQAMTRRVLNYLI